MPRPLLIALLAVAAIAAPPLVGVATAMPPLAGGAAGEPATAMIEFELQANHGLRAHVETFNGEVTLEISRPGRAVSYEVQGQSTEAGLQAQFGTLGSIDVAFRPTKTHKTRPPKGCQGAPETYAEGVFEGTIEFTGEREYVQIEASRARGTMEVIRELEWTCGAHHGVRTGASRPRAGADRRARPARQPATLAAVDRHCRCYFAAYSIPDDSGQRPSLFVGAKVEEREGMKIARATYAEAGRSAFAFDFAAGSATARPPLPFTGSASFERRPHRRDLWRSTIRVPLLGADPLRLGGPRFHARLVPKLPGD